MERDAADRYWVGVVNDALDVIGRRDAFTHQERIEMAKTFRAAHENFDMVAYRPKHTRGCVLG